MNRAIVTACVLWGFTVAPGSAAQPALTIYNQKFAVVRDTVPLDLKSGRQRSELCETTAHVEPDSVILRDPAGKMAFRFSSKTTATILSRRISYCRLMKARRSISRAREGSKEDRKGQNHSQWLCPACPAGDAAVWQNYYVRRRSRWRGGEQRADHRSGRQIAVRPSRTAAISDTQRRHHPQADNRLAARGGQGRKTRCGAVLCHRRDELGSDYNVVAPEKGDLLDFIGWVTMDNQSGKTFANARIKLMAGDVSKIQLEACSIIGERGTCDGSGGGPTVTEKAFDDYHLYTLARPTTLHDRETKQVEFIRATGVKSERLYVYDGLKVDWNQWRGDRMENIRNNEEWARRWRPRSRSCANSRTRKQSPRHAAAQGPGPFLPAGRRQAARVHRGKS